MVPPTHVERHFVCLGASIKDGHHTKGEHPEPSVVIEEEVVLVAKGVRWSDYGGTGKRFSHNLLTICLGREGGREGGKEG